MPRKGNLGKEMVWRDEKEGKVEEVQLGRDAALPQEGFGGDHGKLLQVSYGWHENLHILSSFMQLWKINSSAITETQQQNSPGKPKGGLASSSENHVLVNFSKTSVKQTPRQPTKEVCLDLQLQRVKESMMVVQRQQAG